MKLMDKTSTENRLVTYHHSKEHIHRSSLIREKVTVIYFKKMLTSSPGAFPVKILRLNKDQKIGLLTFTVGTEKNYL